MNKTALIVFSLALIALIITLLNFGFKKNTQQAQNTPDSLSQTNAPGKIVLTAGQSQLQSATDLQHAKENRLPRNITKGHYILISKSQFRLDYYFDGKLQKSYPIAIGEGDGDKTSTKVRMTPEGHFIADKIRDSSYWTYDFGDGKGPTPGAYGPWFINIITDRPRTFSGEGWTGIGIHGTHDDSSIGKKITHGCLRMHNADLIELKNELNDSIKQRPIDVDIIP